MNSDRKALIIEGSHQARLDHGKVLRIKNAHTLTTTDLL